MSKETQLGMLGSKGRVDAKLKRTLLKHSVKGVQQNCECLFLGEGDIISSYTDASLFQIGPILLSNSDGHLLAVIQVKRCGLCRHKILMFFTIASYIGQEPTPNDIRSCDCDSPLYLYATIEIKRLLRPGASYRLVAGSSGDGKPVLSEPSEKKSKVVFKIVVEKNDCGTIAKFIELD
jgi:hypothetical protein